MIGEQGRHGGHRRRRRGRGRGAGAQHLRVREFVVAYLSGLAAWFASIVMSVTLQFPISPFAYLVIGVALARFVSRRFQGDGPLQWNWHLASLADVAKAKVSMVLAWPFALPVLIWQLFVFKYL